MKFIFSVAFTLMLHCSAFSQTKQDLTGNWKVVNVELANGAGQEEKQMLGVLKSVFANTTFHFGGNSVFSLKSPDKDLAINNAVWKMEEDRKLLIITEPKSTGKPGILMEIAVKLREGKYYFLMSETPVILMVEKIPS